MANGRLTTQAERRTRLVEIAAKARFGQNREFIAADFRHRPARTGQIVTADPRDE